MMPAINRTESVFMNIGYFDGACNPNPGEVGLGTSIINGTNEEIDWAFSYREHGTNNQSEYLSVILLLKRAIYLGITDMTCRGDSNLVINQINGKFRCNSQLLSPLLDKVRSLTRHFNNIQFEWVRRNENKRADELSKLGVINKRSEYSEAVQHSGAIQAAIPAKKATTALKTLVPVKNSITVKLISGGRYLIADKQSTTIFNSKNMTCSCNTFQKQQWCLHTANFMKLKTNTKLLRQMSSQQNRTH
jgi:ribonuclease HI